MVMQSYTEGWGRGAAWDGIPMLPAPVGAGLGQTNLASLLAEVSTALQLRPLGVYTPWATRSGDLTWDEIGSPDTNIALFGLTDAQIAQVPQVTFGSPLPFVAVITKLPLTRAQVDAMWEGTAYEQYETQGVYRLDDAQPIPTIYFLHWGSRRDSDSASQRTLTVGPRAEKVGGALVFAAQVPYERGTTRSGPPVISFTEAIGAQLGPVGPPPAEATVMPDTAAPAAPAAAPAKSDLTVPIAVGAAAGLAAFFLWRRRR